MVRLAAFMKVQFFLQTRLEKLGLQGEYRTSTFMALGKILQKNGTDETFFSVYESLRNVVFH